MSLSRMMLASILVVTLAACGGGGGGGGSATAGGGGVTPPVTPANNMAQQSVQRADVQSSIAGVQAVREYTGGSATPLARRAAAMKAQMLRSYRGTMLHLMASCSNGQTSSTTAGPNNTTIITVSSYYDVLCTQIEDTLTFTATQSGNSFTGPLTYTTYSNAGVVTETASGTAQFLFNSSSQLTGLSFLLTSITSGSKSLGEVGIGCSIVGVITCGVAVAADVPGAGIEDGVNVSMTVSGTTNASFSLTATTYQGGADSLSIANASFPLFSISPAADQTNSISMSGSQNGSTVSLTATDSANGGTVSLSGTATAMTGTVMRNDTNATVASFTLDGFGNGTLTYGNGTKVSITNYNVQG